MCTLNYGKSMYTNIRDVKGVLAWIDAAWKKRLDYFYFQKIVLDGFLSRSRPIGYERREGLIGVSEGDGITCLPFYLAIRQEL